ncbi:hypothetical protein B296_00018926 [Ensete ventricosum]|uniref:Uncharacterized protein n=1 Tax=Ensete ventricosum TaxID=4639 RepID=A0A426ZZ15_ENSVE|nr:hypothetical protein B296_00018926 [Ensete ventricosum]
MKVAEDVTAPFRIPSINYLPLGLLSCFASTCFASKLRNFSLPLASPRRMSSNAKTSSVASSSSSSSSVLATAADGRLPLPVMALRDKIVAKILGNRVTLIIGDTGWIIADTILFTRRVVLMSATADITRYRDYFKDLGRDERVEVIAIPNAPQHYIFQRKVLYLDQLMIVIAHLNDQETYDFWKVT